MQTSVLKTLLSVQLPRLLLIVILAAPWTLHIFKQPSIIATSPRPIDLQVTTFNTEYWHIPERELVDLVDYQAMDLVLLQEHLELRGEEYFPTNRIAQLQQVLEGRFVAHNGEVVTISKWPIESSRSFTGGEALRTDVRLADGGIASVYNIHLPVHLHLKLLKRPADFIRDASSVARRRESLLQEVIADIRSNPNPIIVGGDFNTSLAMPGVAWFREHLHDTYAAQHCDAQDATWSVGGLLRWRIDYIFVSSDFLPESYCIKPVPAIVSDHSALVAGLAYPGKHSVDRQLGAKR
jgi:endonuclease/exonuclease/phosphatase (EEP) superfamily protein YafD